MKFTLGNTIKRLRKEKGITQEALAGAIGVSFQAISKWETDTTLPDITLLPKLASFFGVKIDDLFSIDRSDELERVDSILYNEILTDKSFAYAKEILEAALTDCENNSEILKKYSELLLQRIKQDSLHASQLLERAMKSAPDDEEVFTLYRRTKGGTKISIRNDNELFVRVCEPYVHRYPNNVKLCELLIEAMLDLGAYNKAEEIISLIPYNSEYTRCLGEVFQGDIALAKGDIQDAIRIWKTVDPCNHKAQYEIGERFSSINEYEMAITCFQNSFEAASSPKDLSALYSLAFLYVKLERYEEAISVWQCILRVLADDYGITEGETVDWPKREIEGLKAKLN